MSRSLTPGLNDLTFLTDVSSLRVIMLNKEFIIGRQFTRSLVSNPYDRFTVMSCLPNCLSFPNPDRIHPMEDKPLY